MCMSRIIFVGGGASLPGLKQRVLDELTTLIEESAWDPVRGKAIGQLRSNHKILQSRRRQANPGPIEVPDET